MLGKLHPEILKPDRLARKDLYLVGMMVCYDYPDFIYGFDGTCLATVSRRTQSYYMFHSRGPRAGP